MKIKYIALLVFPFLFSFTADVNPKAIIKKAEEQLRGVSTSYSEMSISIKRKKWTRNMEMKSWSKGEDYALTLITAPTKDKGTVFLKRGKEVWNWLPTVERNIKLPPSMMSQSWMGTDLTNDDLVRQSSLAEDFTHKYLGMEKIGGMDCYKIESYPKEEAVVVWGKIISWIAKDNYIQMKTDFYDEDEDLVNTFKASDLRQFGNRKLAATLTIVPSDKPENKTILTYKKLIFDQPLSSDFFSIKNMKKLK